MCYKICVIICDMNSTLGSVVPLAMFRHSLASGDRRLSISFFNVYKYWEYNLWLKLIMRVN